MFDSAQSFVIKVWLEGGPPRPPRGGRVPWQGQMTHLPGGERRAVRRLDDLVEVIASVLERSGADLGWRWHWRLRWRRWRRGPP